MNNTKLGKRKNYKGHEVEGIWCIGIIKRTNENRFTYISIEKRDVNIMSPVQNSNVKPGSIVYIDCWKAYIQSCRDHGFGQHPIKHSIGLKGSDTGIYRT